MEEENLRMVTARPKTSPTKFAQTVRRSYSRGGEKAMGEADRKQTEWQHRCERRTVPEKGMMPFSKTAWSRSRFWKCNWSRSRKCRNLYICLESHNTDNDCWLKIGHSVLRSAVMETSGLRFPPLPSFRTALTRMLTALVVTFRPLLITISEIYFRLIGVIFSFINLFFKKSWVPKPNNNLLLISATQAADMIRKREITSLELVEAYISRIEQVNGIINAVVQKDFENARAKAADADALIGSVEPGSDEWDKLIKEQPLLGVPFTIKDCIEVGGLVCTVGISYREGLIAEKDAVVVQRMKAAGAIPLAVTNVPEVCMWWESYNPLHGRSSNPYDTRRITGGSSGGEAALIASAGSVIGIGSDIGGSIRMPGYFNGIFGLKPTSGVVPLTGHLPAAEGYRTEMLRIGPMCRYAEDLSLMLKILAADDATSLLQLDTPVNLRKIRVFYMEGLKTPFAQSITSDAYTGLMRAVNYFETKYDLCAIRLDLPFAHYAIEFFLASMEVPGAPSFAHHMTDLKTDLNCVMELGKWAFRRSRHTLPAILAGIIDKQSPFNDEQKRLLMSQRDRLNRELKELLLDDGILIFPSFPTVAPFHSQPLFTPLNFAYTALWNTLAFPVVQCPMGLNKSGIPLGVQVIGAPATDRLLIAVAQDLEGGFGGWKPPCLY